MYPGWPITPVQKISMATSFIFAVIQVEWETVMTAWRLHWGLRESDQYSCHMLSSVVIRMLSLSIVFVCIVIMHIFFCDLFTIFLYYVLINVMSFMVWVMNGLVQGLLIPSHTPHVFSWHKLYVRTSSL